MPTAQREILAFLIWVALALPAGIAYARFLSDGLGRHVGIIAGAIVVGVPAGILVFSVVLWLPVWALARHLLRSRLGCFAPVLAAVLVVPAAFTLCGGNCFVGQHGAEPYLAWFVMAPAALAAFLHDRWSQVWLGPAKPL